MERLRITELLEALPSKEGARALNRTELAELVFGEDLGRPQEGASKPLSLGRKRNLIGDWDRGKNLTAIKPRHIMRLARALRIREFSELIEE